MEKKNNIPSLLSELEKSELKMVLKFPLSHLLDRQLEEEKLDKQWRWDMRVLEKMWKSLQ